MTMQWVERDSRILTPATEDQLAAAKQMREVRDSLHGQGTWLANPEKRWVGDLGEGALGQWAGEQGHRVDFAGGIDQPEDLWIDGQSVGVKTHCWHWPPPPREQARAFVLMPEQHIDRPVDWLAFCAYIERDEGQLPLIALCGAVPLRNFRFYGTKLVEGDKLPNGAAVRNTCRMLPERELDRVARVWG